MIRKARRKPVDVEYVVYTGTIENCAEIAEWMGKGVIKTLAGCMLLETSFGETVVNPNDVIIKGIDGGFYPCKASVFGELHDDITEEIEEEEKPV